MSRDRSSKKRYRSEDSEEFSGEIKKIRTLPSEKRIVKSKLNEGKSSQIIDFFAFGANDKGQLGTDPETLGNSMNLVFLKKISDLNCISYTCAKDSALVAEVNSIPRYRNVYSWGGDEAVLARSMDEEFYPARIEHLHEQPIIQVAAGGSHVIALTTTGEVVSWGIYKDTKGKFIGFRPHMPKDEYLDVPEIITELEDVKITQLACTSDRSIALSEVGDVYEWGNTRLKNKTSKRHITDSLLPSKVLMTAKIQAIYAGSNGGCIFAETTDGEVYAWGNNQYYQCGIDELVTVSKKLKDPESGALRAEQKKKKIATHSRPAKAKQINDVIEEDGITIKKMCSGKLHSVMLSKSGKVYTWGDNTKGQLGLGTGVKDIVKPTVIEDIPKIVDISSGPFHTLLLAKNGDVYGFGINKDRCLGDLDDIQNIPGKIDLEHNKMRGKIIGVECGSRHNLIISDSS